MSKSKKDSILSEDIINRIKELNKLYEIEYEMIKPQVDYIIKNLIRDLKLIENILEKLLNLPNDKCYELFKKLCFYTATFDTKFANDYLNLYDELYSEKKENTLIK